VKLLGFGKSIQTNFNQEQGLSEVLCPTDADVWFSDCLRFNYEVNLLQLRIIVLRYLLKESLQAFDFLIVLNDLVT